MEPLRFTPYLRPLVWGGRNLESLGKELPGPGAYGESWEISAHPLHASRVAEGPLKGRTLPDIWETRSRELAGSKHVASAFPLLFKFLDVADRFSVQVHPSDDNAPRWRPGERGKTEAWVVLHAEPGARVYAGLASDRVTPDQVRQALGAGALSELLHGFHPSPGDTLFLLPGTVHAAAGGILMAEIQQSSDATFRLYDWDRPGSHGRPRELHLDAALDVIAWDRGPLSTVRPTPLPAPDGARGDRLAACDHFVLDRYEVSGRLENPTPGRMAVWMFLDGGGQLTWGTGPGALPCSTGDSLLIPASCEGAVFTPAPRARFLATTLPKT